MTLIKEFKYEIIKIVVFLLLFTFSLIYVITLQKGYYTPSQKNISNSADTLSKQ
jgi:hypothetical protein